MKLVPRTFLRVAALAVVGTALVACEESPTEPGIEVDARLAAAANGAGLGGGSGSTLPQGSAAFTGAGGVAMEAAAEEFIQQLTLQDGTVLRTSGVGIYAVVEEGVTAPFEGSSFGAAHTGLLTSVEPGSYDITVMPEFDFIEPKLIAYADTWVRPEGELSIRTYAQEGVVTIESIELFPDVYTCELTGSVIVADRCDYQVGLVHGTIEFTITPEDGEPLVQERTDFSLPLRKRTIIAHLP